MGLGPLQRSNLPLAMELSGPAPVLMNQSGPPSSAAKSHSCCPSAEKALLFFGLQRAFLRMDLVLDPQPCTDSRRKAIIAHCGTLETAA